MVVVRIRLTALGVSVMMCIGSIILLVTALRRTMLSCVQVQVWLLGDILEMDGLILNILLVIL